MSQRYVLQTGLLIFGVGNRESKGDKLVCKISDKGAVEMVVRETVVEDKVP